MADIDATLNGTNAENANGTDTVTETETTSANESAEIAKLRAEMAKQKAALDKATKEAAESKRALRAKQSAEEIAAEEKRVADEERDKKLAEYEKRFTVAESAKKVMTFVGDEASANTVAEYLYGATDVDGAIDALNRAWMAREKKLRAEFGRLPAPGAGGSEGNNITKNQLDVMTYTERVKFANEHPDEYERLMGRK